MTDHESNQVYEVAIVGAGISGLATAVALIRLGITNIIVLEKSNSLRSTGTAITLLPNAWRALHALGVAHKLTAMYDPCQKSIVINLDKGSKTEVSKTVASQRGKMETRVVHRKALIEALAEELPDGIVRFSSNLVSIKREAKNDTASLKYLLLEDETTIKTKVVLGCDGVHSKVAQWLGLSKPISSGRSAIRSLAMFPEGHGLPTEFRLYVHRDKGLRGLFVPLNKTELYWAIVHKTSMSDLQDPEKMLSEVLENAARNFPEEFLTVVKHSVLSTVTQAPLLLRTPWDILFCQAHQWNVTIAGDALHPMTPDIAQGGCTSLEDAVVLARNVFSGTRITESGFERYARERQWRTACVTGFAYLEGWVPRDDRSILSWFMGWFIQKVFLKFIFPRGMNYATEYDCGNLPAPSM